MSLGKAYVKCVLSVQVNLFICDFLPINGYVEKTLPVSQK